MDLSQFAALIRSEESAMTGGGPNGDGDKRPIWPGPQDATQKKLETKQFIINILLFMAASFLFFVSLNYANQPDEVISEVRQAILTAQESNDKISLLINKTPMQMQTIMTDFVEQGIPKELQLGPMGDRIYNGILGLFHNNFSYVMAFLVMVKLFISHGVVKFNPTYKSVVIDPVQMNDFDSWVTGPDGKFIARTFSSENKDLQRRNKTDDLLAGLFGGLTLKSSDVSDLFGDLSLGPKKGGRRTHSKRRSKRRSKRTKRTKRAKRTKRTKGRR